MKGSNEIKIKEIVNKEKWVMVNLYQSMKKSHIKMDVMMDRASIQRS